MQTPQLPRITDRTADDISSIRKDLQYIRDALQQETALRKPRSIANEVMVGVIQGGAVLMIIFGILRSLFTR
jgi:hypothetical protein